MAKKSTTTERRGRQTREELMRELGLDELTYEACVRELFAEFIATPDGTRAQERVIQTGPGRR
jgi:hypothetical protein